MSEERQGPDLTGLENPDVKYEHTDASVRGVVWFLAMLTVAGFLIHLVLAGMYKYFAGPGISLYQRQPAGEVYSMKPRPPAPALQPDPVADFNELRALQVQRLNSYGWVDQKAGMVHIPIGNAMELLVQRGIPARPPQPAAGYRETLNMGAAAPGGLVIPQSVQQKNTPPQK